MLDVKKILEDEARFRPALCDLAQICLWDIEEVLAVLGEWSSGETEDATVWSSWHTSFGHYPSSSEHSVGAGAGPRGCTRANPLETSIEASAAARSHDWIGHRVVLKRGANLSKLVLLFFLDHRFSNALFLSLQLIHIIFFDEALTLQHPCCLNIKCIT